MVQRFNLTVDPERKRGDIDAVLELDGKKINFELKSTTSDSVSTVRDFGPDHIAKWRDNLHWLFAFYKDDGVSLKYCVYASPTDMEGWIGGKETYIAPDLKLADALPSSVDSSFVTSVLGAKASYTKADAQLLMKKQWSAAQYRDNADLTGGLFSLQRMTELMQARAQYVILRGSTLNNPHIEAKFFDGFEHITAEHASRLRELVRGYLSTLSSDSATA